MGVILCVVLKQQNIKLSAGKSKSALDVFFLDIYSPFANWTSFGISIKTGPGLPFAAIVKASCKTEESLFTS